MRPDNGLDRGLCTRHLLPLTMFLLFSLLVVGGFRFGVCFFYVAAGAVSHIEMSGTYAPWAKDRDEEEVCLIGHRSLVRRLVIHVQRATTCNSVAAALILL